MGYLTAIHLAFQSRVAPLCRRLIFPSIVLTGLYFYLSAYRFIYVLAMGEALTFALAMFYLIRHRPSSAIAELEELKHSG